MTDLEKRIENLERHTRIGKTNERIKIVVVYRDDTTKPTETQEEAAIADFKAKNPDWKEGEIITIEWENGQFKAAETRFHKGNKQE